MEENEEFDSDFNTEGVPISTDFWNYMESYWHNNREFPESTETSLNKKADLVGGKVPASQLPSYMDDVLEFEFFENLPNPGEKGKIYVVKSDNTQYRWGGSDYVQINSTDDLMTTTTFQEVTGIKRFFNTGNAVDDLSLQIWGKNGAKAGMFFYSDGMDTAQINFDGYFNFKNQDDIEYRNIKAAGFIKDGYNNGSILLAGGGHKAISDFAQASDLNFYHKKDPSTGLNNVSDTHTNQTWFDFNWANTGYLGSVINGSGFGGADQKYNTEIFASYNNYYAAIRTKQGDTNTWNDPMVLWHNKNFNPDDFKKVGARNLILNSKSFGFYSSDAVGTSDRALGEITITGSGFWNGYGSMLLADYTPSEKLMFQLEVRHNNSTTINMTFYFYNNGDNQIFTQDIPPNVWTKVTKLSSPNQTTQVLMGMGATGTDIGTKVEYRNIQVEEGKAISTYRPAYEDFVLSTQLNDYWKRFTIANYHGINTDTPFSFMTNAGQTAQLIYTGGILASNFYQDAQYIPANGIYSKGNIKTLNYESAIEWAIAYNWTKNEGATMNWVSQNYIPKTHPANNVTSANIGNWLSYTNHNYNMSIQPDQVGNSEFQTGFGSWNNNGGGAGGYMDYIHFGGYSDSSGGNQNLIAFRKNGPGLRQFQNAKGSPTIYGANGSYVDYWHTGNFNPADYVTQLNLNTQLGNCIPKAIQQVINFNTISPTTSGIYRTNNNNGGVKYLYSPMLHLGGTDTATQMQVNYNTGELSYRGGFNGAWNTWRTAWDSGNFNPADYATMAQLNTAIINGNTAFDWGNHATAGYAQAWENASAVGFQSGNPEQPYIYHNTNGYKFLATTDWVQSQDYTTPAFVEETIEQLNREFTNPDYPVHARNKFITIIITDDLPQGYIDLEDDSIPGQQITVINLASFDIDLIRNGNLIDKILSKETTEYYTSDHHRFIKKGSYKSAEILN